MAAKTGTPGIRQRHGRGCKQQGRCRCPWEAFVYSKRDGKKIRKTFPTREAAIAWRDDAKPAVRRNELRAPTSITLAEAAEQWLEGVRSGVIRNKSGDTYKPSTIRTYEQGLRLHILPELGRERLAAIDRDVLQDLTDRLVATGMSGSGVQVILLPLRGIYGRACRRSDSGITINPTAGLLMPKVGEGRERFAEPDECVRLLAALPERDRPIWATAMYAGLRRGELMALALSDVDLAAGVIRVRHSWDAREGLIPTKNRKERRVPISGALRDYLDEHLLRVQWREGFVFGASAVSPFPPDQLRRRALRAWRKLGLNGIGLHECRHTYASLMIAAGVNPKALQTYMGHGSIKITFDLYGKLMPGNEGEAGRLLDDFLARASDDAARASLAPVVS
jgi:integrase